MDVRMQKHRMTRWLVRLFVVLFLMTSWGAQAAVESVPPTISNWHCTFADPNLPLYSNSLKEMVQRTLNYACNLPGTRSCSLVSADLESQQSGRFIRGNIYILRIYTNGVQAPLTGGSFYGEVGCPVPAVNPTVPYKYNSATNMCERDAALTITLTGGSEIEPSSGSKTKSLPFIATVKNQRTGEPPTNPVHVHISLKVEDPKSGGHDHGDNARPRGGIAELDCDSDGECWSHETDGTGAVAFNFNAPEAAGIHTITATCEGCSNAATKTVNVKVDGLRSIFPSGLYALYEADGSVIGAVQGRHRSNHYLTTIAANRLLALAINYHHSYPRAPVLHVNDASLMWGGVFDIDTEAEWSTPHEEHMRGTVVDIRANSRPGAIPPENFASFIQLANDRGAHARIHSSGEANQHFHVRLLNRRE